MDVVQPSRLDPSRLLVSISRVIVGVVEFGVSY
jgi:hypothetical protein